MMRLFSSPPTHTPRKRKFALELNTPNLMPDLAEYMTVKEAAEQLSYTVQGIRRLVKISKLDAVAVGRMYLVSRQSVKIYLDKTQGLSKNDPTRGKTDE